MDHLVAMGVFARVVEANSFSEASRRLGISKSAVSKHISRLEQYLGARLLHRTTRRLSVTEVGAAYYQHCARILSEAEAAELAVSRLHGEPRGSLKLNAPMTFGMLHIAPAIPDFLARYPGMEVDMNMNDRYVDLAEEGFDLAIRVTHEPDLGLVARRLAPARMVVCASPDYLRRYGAPRTPADLQQHNCLRYTYQEPQDTWKFQGPEGNAAVRIHGNLQVNNGDALRTAVLAGVGISLLPTFLVGEDLRQGTLKPLLDGYHSRGSTVYAVYLPHRYVSPKVRAFVDFLLERYGAEPYWDRSARGVAGTVEERPASAGEKNP